MCHKLAIVIPYYKIDFFSETLLSLSRQTDNRFNVYIGDDCSPHAPLELLPILEGLSYQYIRFDENYGKKNLIAHWNRCLSYLKNEEWFVILGDDDYYSENFVEIFYKALASKHTFAFRLNRIQVNNRNEIISKDFSFDKVISSQELLCMKLQGNLMSTLSEYIYTTKAFKEIGFVDLPKAWHSDDLSVVRFSYYGDIVYLEQAHCFVRKSEVNISSAKDDILIKLKASKQYYEYLGNNLNQFNVDLQPVILNSIRNFESSVAMVLKFDNKEKYYYDFLGIKKANLFFININLRIKFFKYRIIDSFFKIKKQFLNVFIDHNAGL